MSQFKIAVRLAAFVLAGAFGLLCGWFYDPMWAWPWDPYPNYELIGFGMQAFETVINLVAASPILSVTLAIVFLYPIRRIGRRRNR